MKGALKKLTPSVSFFIFLNKTAPFLREWYSAFKGNTPLAFRSTNFGYNMKKKKYIIIYIILYQPSVE